VRLGNIKLTALSFNVLADFSSGETGGFLIGQGDGFKLYRALLGNRTPNFFHFHKTRLKETDGKTTQTEQYFGIKRGI
jgi:hypothetical protein